MFIIHFIHIYFNPYKVHIQYTVLLEDNIFNNLMIVVTNTFSGFHIWGHNLKRSR